jgi:hypothetical protein
MKTIDTLVPDIQQVLRNSLDGKGVELTVEQQAELGARIAGKVAIALNRQHWKRPLKTLRMSEIGKPCLRQLWYSYHTPEKGEKLRPDTQLKFLYGDIIEELVLFLAKQAGHKVEGEQTRLEFKHNGWKIVGHRDAIIDGVLVDVKSASSYSFKKFEEGMNDDNDAFGYRAQIGAYAAGTLIQEGKALPTGWVAVDKQNGKVCFSPNTDPVSMPEHLDNVTWALDEDKPPTRDFGDVPEGTSGNKKLCVECSYCPFKKECWPGLRAFAYQRGPVFLTKVVREPKTPEIPLEADSIDATESAA